MAEKAFTLSQSLDYLDNLEVSSDRPSSDVDSGDENTAAADNQVISAVINFLVLLYWK